VRALIRLNEEQRTLRIVARLKCRLYVYVAELRLCSVREIIQNGGSSGERISSNLYVRAIKVSKRS